MLYFEIKTAVDPPPGEAANPHIRKRWGNTWADNSASAMASSSPASDSESESESSPDIAANRGTVVAVCSPIFSTHCGSTKFSSNILVWYQLSFSAVAESLTSV